MGGYGYSMEYDMQRYFWNTRLITVSGIFVTTQEPESRSQNPE
jgi:hypothetical protein